MVLDVTTFMYNHPGGKFLIERNLGRDVSKFFYGGYVLENPKGAKPYTHSNIARRMVNKMIIAHLDYKCNEFKAKIF